jgi:acetyltransferase-like isoleucine patch superfamily enzyme
MSAFISVGVNVKIYPLVKIVAPNNITIGSHVIIDDFVFIGRHKKLQIGNHVHIACHASITGGGETILDDFVGVSSGTRILDGTDSFAGDGLTNPTIPDKYRSVIRGRVILEKHVLVGMNCTILPGVTIGEGTVVGAGTVVTRSLDPWGLYVGNPARRVKDRPSDVIRRYEAELLSH